MNESIRYGYLLSEELRPAYAASDLMGGLGSTSMIDRWMESFQLPMVKIFVGKNCRDGVRLFISGFFKTGSGLQNRQFFLF